MNASRCVHMRRVAHMKTHIWMGHVTHMKANMIYTHSTEANSRRAWCRIYTSDMTHIWMRRVAHMKAHIWMGHVTYMKAHMIYTHGTEANSRRAWCHIYTSDMTNISFFDGYCSTVQGLLDWFEVDLGFTELLFIQIRQIWQIFHVAYVTASCHTYEYLVSLNNTGYCSEF